MKILTFLPITLAELTCQTHLREKLLQTGRTEIPDYINPSDAPALKTARPMTTTKVPTAKKAHPTACCGELPYDSSHKGCCAVKNRAHPIVYNLNEQGCCGQRLINTIEEGCCNNNPYLVTRQDCCFDDIARPDGYVSDGNDFPGCRCEFDNWSEWSSCDAGFAGGFQVRNRNFTKKLPGFEDKECPPIPASTRIQRKYPSFEKRDTDADGNPLCVQQMANRAQKEFESAKVYKDLVILLDESTSIKPANFEFAKNLVKNIVSSLCGGIGPDKNRVAVIRYSAEVKDDILLSNAQNMNKEQVLKTIDSFEYEPIRNSQFSGTTWTATAMEYVFDNVLATEVGWRQGVGTIVCNGIVIGDSCYFLSEQTGMFGEGKSICESESKKNAYAHPASDRLSSKEWNLLQKYLTKSENRQAWMGMEFANVQGIDEWVDYRGHFLVSESDSTSGKAPWAEDQWVDGSVVNRYGCVQIASDGGVSRLQHVNCAEKRQVLCKRNPLDYLSVNTEILLITDGRSNDPKKMGVNVLDMKEKFNGLDVKVSFFLSHTKKHTWSVVKLFDKPPEASIFRKSCCPSFAVYYESRNFFVTLLIREILRKWSFGN